jgi:hypothetical protein
VGTGERYALSRLADRLIAELGDEDGAAGQALPDPTGPHHEMLCSQLGGEEEELIATARQSLAQIAQALGARHSSSLPDRTIQALLDGAELVMRNELAEGRSVQGVIPSFVFLIAIPMVDQDRALELSKRAASLLDL